MAGGIWADGGSSSDIVTTLTNTTGVMDPILEVDPDQGTLVRIANTPAEIGLGSAMGVPHYMKLRSGSSTDLPVSTELQWQIKLAGQDSYIQFSERRENIAIWNQADFTTQNSEDNVDSTKIVFTGDPTDGNGVPTAVSVRDIDKLALAINSSAQISHSDSQIYVESKATETRSR